jgi:hypothetical protein
MGRTRCTAPCCQDIANVAIRHRRATQTADPATAKRAFNAAGRRPWASAPVSAYLPAYTCAFEGKIAPSTDGMATANRYSAVLSYR